MNNTVDREEILKELEPLFEKAEKEGKWFYCKYQGLWFSPQKLREQQEQGRFIWGSCNWELRDPREKLVEMKRQRDSLNREIDQFIKEAGLQSDISEQSRLDFIEVWEMLQEITDKKSWCFKLYRLAGKDYRVFVKKLGKGGKAEIEVYSPPCKTATEAIEKVIELLEEYPAG